MSGLRAARSWRSHTWPAIHAAQSHNPGLIRHVSGASSLKAALSDPTLFKENAYINGKWTVSTSGKTFEVTDPSNGNVLGTCPEMSQSETRSAIGAAQKAFQDFQHTSPRQRMEYLKRWTELMTEHKGDLAKILMFENGRPSAAASAEIAYSTSFFEWFQGEALRSYGETISGSYAGSRAITLNMPIGVVGVLTPWNFPSAMITRKVAAAIAAGCTIVLKPAAETPYSALALAQLGERAGIPPGVFNIVTTNANVAEVGLEICENKDVKKISFTGSTGVGKMLMAQSSSTMKKMSLELGGNAPFIVFNDAKLDDAVAGLMAAKFRASGQTCVCANRVYVQSGIYDKFVEAFAQEVEKSMRPGASEDPNTTLGCLINAKAATKVERLVADATQKGAKILLGGQKAETDLPTFYPATVLRDMTSDMEASTEEIFGPVVGFYPFETESEVLALANKADVGLASYIFTNDLPTAWRMSEALQTGMTGVNTGIISDAATPFGGIKESGFGREGGRVGMDEYQITKTITFGNLGLPTSS